MEKFLRDVDNLLGIKLSPSQVKALLYFEQELLTWSAQFNLTAIRDQEGIRTKHFLDSLSCLLVMRENPQKTLVDVGTGAGFPGVPLKIIYPSLRVTLVESVGKKADFCRHIIRQLGLEQVEVIQSRAEDLGHSPDHREKYDWAVARAVANLPTLAEYLLPLVRIGGAMLAQKGETGPVEAQNAERAIRLLGGHLHQLCKVNLPGVAEDRYLIVIQKKAATPPHYPRRCGMPTKKPL